MIQRQCRYVEYATKGTGTVIWFPEGSADPSSCRVIAPDSREWCEARAIVLTRVGSDHGLKMPSLPKAFLFRIEGDQLLMEFRLRWE